MLCWPTVIVVYYIYCDIPWRDLIVTFLFVIIISLSITCWISYFNAFLHDIYVAVRLSEISWHCACVFCSFSLAVKYLLYNFYCWYLIVIARFNENQQNNEHLGCCCLYNFVSNCTEIPWNTIISLHSLFLLEHVNQLATELYRPTATNYRHTEHERFWLLRSTLITRKLCYRKDDRAMRPTYGCPENFRDCLTTPTATIPNIFMGFCSDRLYECSYKIWSP